MLEDAHLDRLFAAARTEAPKISYVATKRRFLKTLGLGFFGLIAWKWMHWTRNTKIIIMLSTLGMGLSAVLWLGLSTENAPTTSAATLAGITENKIIEAAEDGKTTIIYLDDAHRVVQIVEQQPVELEKNLEEQVQEHSPRSEERSILSAPLSTHPKSDSLIQSGQRITFELTKNILDSDMEKIQLEARKAGVEFRYSLLVWRGKVKKCKFDIYLKNEDHECSYTSELKGNFRKTIGWEVDNSGMATAIITE